MCKYKIIVVKSYVICYQMQKKGLIKLWIIILISFSAAIIAQFITYGFSWITLLIVLPTIGSALYVLYNNSFKVRKTFRMALNYFNISTFDMEFSASFYVEESSNVKHINNDYIKLQDIIYEVLQGNGIDGKKNDLVEVSFDRVSGVKFYVHPYKMYITIDQTDNLGDETIDVKALSRLKYKNGERIIENFNVEFYSSLLEELKLREYKYVLKLVKNNKNNDFMKKHFVKELTPEKIKSFQIFIKHPNVQMTATHKDLTFVTKERSYLINAIKDTIKFIT